MLRLLCLIVALLCSSLSLLCQVEPSATGGSGSSSDDDSLMSLPPSVGGSFYPTAVGRDARSNILSGGVLAVASYDNNVLAGETAHPVAAETYTILPNIRLEERTTRFRSSLSYSPGFMFFDPTSDLNQVTQNAVGEFQYRMTPHTRIGMQEVFQQNSTVFSEPYTVSGQTVTGSAIYQSPIAIAPYAGQIMDSTQVNGGYQFSRSSMVSAAGYFSTYHYSTQALGEGLYNSTSEGGSASYSHRLTRTQSLGLAYRYMYSKTPDYGSSTTSQFGTAYYSVALGQGFSFSITGGPEYTTTASPGIAATSSWAPSGNVGLGFNRVRESFAINYSRSVTTGWGFLGSYTADSANATAKYLLTQRLIAGVNGNYANTKNASPEIITYSPTGHMLFGRASLEYLLGEHVHLVGEYSHLHEDYFGIAALAADPNSDRVALSLNYSFQKPLGR